MCGIIGWSGRDPGKFNKQKFDILGLFNNSRGGDSVGVAVDGEIIYGTLLNKNYDDFIVNKNYNVPVEVPAVIGHMRKASVGGVSENNAHPFGFGGEANQKFEFIGCHNGTLSNYEDLGKKYEVETSVWKEDRIFDRNKVDSEVLLEIIHKTRDIQVLEEYIGGAALLYQELSEPNVIYAFHGASKKEVGDKGETLYEERPLFYYQESKDSVYISSMEEALIFIGGIKGKNVFEFDHNIVYRIENGNVARAKRYKVNRREAGWRKAYGAGFTTGGRAIGATINDYRTSHRKQKKRDKSKTRRSKRLENVCNIYDETVMEGDFKSAIYYNKLRYWRNGHLINGVYTFIKDYGFFHISDVAGDVNEKLYRKMGEHFSITLGMFISDEKAIELADTDSTIFVPFEYGTQTKEPPIFYFYEGIYLETVHDFVALSGNAAKKFTFEQLSEMSRYPICKIGKHRFPDDKQGILYNGMKYTNNFVPVQCNNCYNIENGNLLNIDRFEEEVVKEAETCCSLVNIERGAPAIQIPMKFEPEVIDIMRNPQVKHESGAASFMDKPIVEFLDEDPPIEVLTTEEDEDKILDIINDHVMPIYTQMQICNENLKNEDNEVVQEIIDLQKEYLISIDCIIESKEK